MWKCTWFGPRVTVFVAGLACACSAGTPVSKQESSGQTFAAAMALVCEVDRHIEFGDAGAAFEREQKRTKFLQNHVKNPNVIYHQTLWRVQGNTQRAQTIRELSSEAKLATCPYADALEEEEI